MIDPIEIVKVEKKVWMVIIDCLPQHFAHGRSSISVEQTVIVEINQRVPHIKKCVKEIIVLKTQSPVPVSIVIFRPDIEHSLPFMYKMLLQHFMD
jgi:hypothetical protein